MRAISKILFAAILLVIGCNRTPALTDMSVQVGTDTNELRIPISVQFATDCQYYIEYWKNGGEKVERTATYSSESCRGEAVLMFLSQSTTYQFRVCALFDGEVVTSDTKTFTTRSLPLDVPRYSVVKSDESVEIPGLVLQMAAGSPGFVTFCNTDGEVLWYERFEGAVRQARYDEKTGTLLVNIGFRFSNTGDYQRVAAKTLMIDLKGNRLLELEAGNSYLDYPHHEIVRLEDGNILALHNTVKRFDLTSLGGNADTEVFGEGITIFSPGGDVIWEWDCFSDWDVLNDPTVDPVSFAFDLIHANSVCKDTDGNLYISHNRINEIWKIDYKTRNVLYRAKCDTDGIHGLESLAPDRIICLDNGTNLQTSRAVIYDIDPQTGVPTTLKSVEYPNEYCSSNRSNVDYHPEEDMMMYCSTVRLGLIFTDLEGKILKILKRNDISYRAYWFKSIEY